MADVSDSYGGAAEYGEGAVGGDDSPLNVGFGSQTMINKLVLAGMVIVAIGAIFYAIRYVLKITRINRICGDFAPGSTAHKTCKEMLG